MWRPWRGDGTGGCFVDVGLCTIKIESVYEETAAAGE